MGSKQTFRVGFEGNEMYLILSGWIPVHYKFWPKQSCEMPLGHEKIS